MQSVGEEGFVYLSVGKEQGWPCIAEQAVFLLGHRPDIPVDVFHPVLMFATGKDTHYLDRCFWLAVTNGCDKES